MSRLARQTMSASFERRWADVPKLLRDQQLFIVEHMVNWLPDFAKVQATEKRANVYPVFAAALADFVRIDAGFLAEAFAWVSDCIQQGVEPNNSVDQELQALASVLKTFDQLKTIRLMGLEENELREIV